MDLCWGRGQLLMTSLTPGKLSLWRHNGPKIGKILSWSRRESCDTSYESSLPADLRSFLFCYYDVIMWRHAVSATNFLLPKINNIVDIWQYSNNYRFPHCRLRTILSKIGNAHTFLLPFSALPITNNIVENRKRASMFHCRNTEISSVAENYKLSHVLTYIIMFLVKKYYN